MSEYKLKNPISEDRKKSLKSKYGNDLTVIKVKNHTKKETENFVFKKYSMESMRNANVLLKDDNRSDFDRATILFNDALVFGDEEAPNNVDVFPELVSHLKSLRDEVEVEVGKL